MILHVYGFCSNSLYDPASYIRKTWNIHRESDDLMEHDRCLFNHCYDKRNRKVSEVLYYRLDTVQEVVQKFVRIYLQNINVSRSPTAIQLLHCYLTAQAHVPNTSGELQTIECNQYEWGGVILYNSIPAASRGSPNACPMHQRRLLTTDGEAVYMCTLNKKDTVCNF